MTSLPESQEEIVRRVREECTTNEKPDGDHLAEEQVQQVVHQCGLVVYGNNVYANDNDRPQRHVISMAEFTQAMNAAYALGVQAGKIEGTDITE